MSEKLSDGIFTIFPNYEQGITRPNYFDKFTDKLVSVFYVVYVVSEVK